MEKISRFPYRSHLLFTIVERKIFLLSSSKYLPTHSPIHVSNTTIILRKKNPPRMFESSYISFDKTIQFYQPFTSSQPSPSKERRSHLTKKPPSLITKRKKKGSERSAKKIREIIGEARVDKRRGGNG